MYPRECAHFERRRHTAAIEAYASVINVNVPPLEIGMVESNSGI